MSNKSTASPAAVNPLPDIDTENGLWRSKRKHFCAPGQALAEVCTGYPACCSMGEALLRRSSSRFWATRTTIISKSWTRRHALPAPSLTLSDLRPGRTGSRQRRLLRADAQRLRLRCGMRIPAARAPVPDCRPFSSRRHAADRVRAHETLRRTTERQLFLLLNSSHTTTIYSHLSYSHD